MTNGIAPGLPGYRVRMGKPTVNSYQSAGQVVDTIEQTLNSPEQKLAAAQVDATLAVADQLAELVKQVARLATAMETLQALPKHVSDGAELLRVQIRELANR